MENEQLKQYVERIEKLQEEISEIQADVRQVFAEIKDNGFDTKAIKEIIKLRKLHPADREELLFNLNTYNELMK